MEYSVKKQRKKNTVVNLPKILSNPANFKLLKARGKENYRVLLYEMVNQHLAEPKHATTLKLYFLYPERIPSGKGLLTVLEEALNRVLQIQAENLKKKLETLAKEKAENTALIGQINEVLAGTEKSNQDYETQN